MAERYPERHPGELSLMVEDLAAERGSRRILSGIDFQLHAGEALLVTGPNGAGKSTLLRVIAGFIAPAAGRVVLSPADPHHSLGERIHYVGHLNALRSSLSVSENATFWARYLGGSSASVRPALERFGLDRLADIPAGYLSAGQKRRLCLARLLLAHRPLWLLDEPTAALDQASAEITEEVVVKHTASGGLAIVATHHVLGLANARELKLDASARP